MNKKRTVIVAEGKTDKAFLSSFLDCEIVITNGSCVPRETIEYLKSIENSADIVVLTDPDFSGKRIRTLLDAEIPNLYHSYVDKKYCIKHHKVGIAESEKEYVLKSLEHLLKNQSTSTQKIWTIRDLYDLNLVGVDGAEKKRRLVEEKFHLGYNNAKSLCKRLNARQVSHQELEEFMKELKNDE